MTILIYDPLTGKYLPSEDPPKRADLVEVVRCKDCKHNLGKTANGELILCHYITHGILHTRNINWFCADGERKDDE